MITVSRPAARIIALVAVLFMLFLGTFPQIAYAASYTVSKTADTNDGVCDADCSLREAITAANATAANDTITFGVAGPFTLTSPLPTITGGAGSGALVINGNGTANTMISGDGQFRVLNFQNATVTMSNFMIFNGYVPSGGGTGAGINIDGGSVTISDCIIQNNVNNASSGGGIYAGGGTTLQVSRCTFSSNNVTNTGTGGSGIYVFGSTATVTNSTFTNNSGRTSLTANGGGTLNVVNSTLSGNHNSYTIESYGTVNVTHSTITSNGGWGLSLDSGSASVGHSIIVDSAGPDIYGNFNSLGYNIYAVHVAGTASGDTATNIITGNAGLGPLANNGGDTQTRALLVGSVAYNAGNPSFSGSPTTDQRGQPRVSQGRIDIGAYESVDNIQYPVVSISPATFSVSEGSNSNFTLTRTGVTTSSLAVTVNITRGANTTASDYTLSGGSVTAQDGSATVTIPAGSLSVNVNFTAADDTEAEPDNTLTVALVDGALYDLGTPNSSTITIPANDFAVTINSDSGEGSLRQALTNAANIPGDDTITFVTSGPITITSPLFIYGSGATTIDPAVNGGPGSITVQRGSGNFTLIEISDATATLNYVTVTGGSSTTAGGGIWTRDSTVSINNSTISNNVSTYAGGGLYILRGTVTLTNTTVSGNDSGNQGGGIYNVGALTITNSTITGNDAGTVTPSIGGAIYHNGTSLSITNSRIMGNTASNGSAIYNDAASGGSVGSSTCIVNNNDTAVVSAAGSLTATGNWWGSAWGPNISAAPTDSGSFVSTGDSIIGAGQSSSLVNVGIVNIPADYGDYDEPPIGSWLATAPASCSTCTQVSTIAHGSRTCS